MNHLSLLLAVSLTLPSTSLGTSLPQPNPKDVIKAAFKAIIENMEPSDKDYARYFSPDYRQEVDGKVLDFAGFKRHMKAQKEVLKSAKVTFNSMLAEGNQVATRHTVVALKKDGKELEVLVIAFWEIENGKIKSCRELTHLVRGDSRDRDLGSRE